MCLRWQKLIIPVYADKILKGENHSCQLDHNFFVNICNTRVSFSGTTAKSRKRKFVPSSHPGPFAVVASSRKSQTTVGTLACFDFFCIRMS